MKRLVIAAVVLGCCAGSVALAAVQQVDPTTVPTGPLVAGNQVKTPLKIKVGHDRTHGFASGSSVYTNHVRLTAGQSTGWHTHPGPVLVTIVHGSLTLYDAPSSGTDDSADRHHDNGNDHGDSHHRKHHQPCPGVTYTEGQGFIDMGFGHVHIAIAGSDGADIYATYILPPNSPPDAALNIPAPAPANPACPRG
jgi:hypothetical protein